MKLCRYDDDRLGVVIGDMVHDVTAAQTEIRNSTPYAAKVDPVVAALTTWRPKLEAMAKSAPGKPISQVKLLSPVAQAAENHCRADQLRQAHRGDAEVPRHRAGARALFARHREGRHLPQVQHLAGRPVGGHSRCAFPTGATTTRPSWWLIIGKQGSDIPKEKAWDYIAGYALGLDMTARGQEDRSFRKSIDGYTVLGPWMITADELPNPADVPFNLHVNDEKRQESNTELPDFRHPEADRVRLAVLHALSWRPLLHRHAGGRRPGKARRLDQPEVACRSSAN